MVFKVCSKGDDFEHYSLRTSELQVSSWVQRLLHRRKQGGSHVKQGVGHEVTPKDLHMSSSRKQHATTDRLRWVLSVHTDGLYPQMVIILFGLAKPFAPPSDHWILWQVWYYVAVPQSSTECGHIAAQSCLVRPKSLQPLHSRTVGNLAGSLAA